MGSLQGPCKVSITGMLAFTKSSRRVEQEREAESRALLLLEVSSHCWGTELLQGAFLSPAWIWAFFARTGGEALSQGFLPS